MNLRLLLAADYANISQEGKLNVMGIFNEISAHNFPCRHSSMHLVITLVPELGEYGISRSLFVRLFAPDGNEVMYISGQIDVPQRGHGRPPEVNVILELKDLVFPKPGPYQFVVLVDKDQKGELRIDVKKKPNVVESQGK